MGSLGAPGHFQITLSAVYKGSGHYIQYGIKRLQEANNFELLSQS